MNRTKHERVNTAAGTRNERREVQLKGSEWAKLQAKEYDKNSEHPTPEQLLVREAAKWLTPKQKKVWEMYNYDRLTQDEIAKKLGIKQQTVQESIKAIEARIAKWVNSNMGAYKLLKSDLGEQE